MAENKQEPVTEPESLQRALNRICEAQKKFASFTQEQVDRIFFAAARAASKERIPLAKMAVAETGMGIVEDKVIKNHYLFWLTGNDALADKYLALFCKKSNTARHYVDKWLSIVAASQLHKGKQEERELLLHWANVVEYA